MGTVPQNLPGCPTGSHPTSGRAVPGALPAGTPSLSPCTSAPFPHTSLRCHCPLGVCQHPQFRWHWVAATPLPIFPQGGHTTAFPKGGLSLHGWDQTQQGSHWGDCSGDKDPAMPVTSTWRALSPPNSCIPPEPVWQGPVQVPRKRHPGRAFPGHALLHSSAESTKSRKGFLEPGAPTVLLVAPKVTHGSQCQWCPPVSHSPSRDPAEGWEGKKEEAETSEK